MNKGQRSDTACDRGDEQAEADERLRALGTLTAGITHEFNNVLFVVANAAELARDADSAEARSEALTLLLEAIERGQELTRELTSFSTGDAEPSDGAVEVDGVLKRVAAMLQRLLPRRFTLATELEPQLGQIDGKRADLSRAVLTVALTARDAIAEGGTLTLRAYRNSATELVVESVGCAEAPDPSSPLARGQDEKAEGSNPGLSTATSAAQRLGGRVTVEPMPDGCRVRLTVRLARSSSTAPPSARPRGRAQGATVLLVDEDPLVRVSVARVLRSAGYRVHEAENTLDALRVWERLGGAVDLVVADTALPPLGAESAGAPTTLTAASVPMLLCPTFQREGPLASAAHPVLTKPFSGQQLLRQVEQMLAATQGETAR